MANETLGASFSIDVTDLKAGLSQANKLIRESESEFKAAAAGMDNWTKSQEGLESRLKHLNTSADLQRQKVDALQQEYDRLISEGLDPTSNQAVELRTKINKETEALNKNETEIRKQTAALEELENASDEAGDAVQDAGDAAEDAGDGFTVAKGAIATFIGNGLSALAGAAKNAIGSLLGLAESTREYRTIMASLENSSKLAGYTVEETEATFRQLNGVLGDTQGAATTTANLQAIGLEQGKLQELTNGVIGAWAKYGDSIPIDGLAEAANHTIKLGEVQGTLADVIEWGGGTVDDFNAKLATCTTETERADMIQKLLAEQGLTEAGKAWQENNKSIVDANNAQADYEKTTAALGEKIEPITNKVREGFNNILSKVLELVNGVDMEAFGRTIDGAFTTFTNNILPVIVDGLQWIINNKDGLIAGIVGIGAAFAAFKVVSLIQGVVAAMEGMTIAQYALNLAMSMNPIGIVVAAIAGLVAGFVVLWNKCDAFREFWINLWEGIKTAFGVVVEWLKENWKTLLLFITNPLAGVFKYCYDNFEGFREMVDGVVKKVKDYFTNLWADITNIYSKVAAWFNDKVIKPVANFFKNLWTDLKDGATAAWKAITDVFIKAASWVNDKVIKPIWNFLEPFVHNAKVLITGTWEAIKAIFSVVAKWFNDNVIKPVEKFFKGLWDGLKSGASAAWQAISNAFSSAATWFNQNIIQPITNFFTGLWNAIKSGATAAWQGISNAFSVAKAWFNDNIVSPVTNAFTGMWEKLKSGATAAWQGVKETFSTVASYFGNVFGNAWQKVKDVFSVGGQIFDGIKDGIVSAFKNIVNAIIKGINKVVATPFNAINNVLTKLKNVSIAGIKPFSGLISNISVPQIPLLARGGVVDEATAAIIGEDGAEAVMPLEKNTGWIKQLAREIAAEQGQGLTVNQNNYYKQAYTSRIEKYKSKQELYAAARLIKAGAY